MIERLLWLDTLLRQLESFMKIDSDYHSGRLQDGTDRWVSG